MRALLHILAGWLDRVGLQSANRNRRRLIHAQTGILIVAEIFCLVSTVLGTFDPHTPGLCERMTVDGSQMIVDGCDAGYNILMSMPFVSMRPDDGHEVVVGAFNLFHVCYEVRFEDPMEMHEECSTEGRVEPDKGPRQALRVRKEFNIFQEFSGGVQRLPPLRNPDQVVCYELCLRPARPQRGWGGPAPNPPSPEKTREEGQQRGAA